MAEPSAVARGPLSSTQQVFRLFDDGDAAGGFGHHYTVVTGLRLTGEIHVDELQAALDDVVHRQEALRTSIARSPRPAECLVHPPGPTRLTEERMTVPPRDRAERVQLVLNRIESLPFDPNDLPLLRATLVRFDAREALLVLVTHHIATDAWSMQLIVRDLAARYGRRTVGESAALPWVRPHRELAIDQQRATTPIADAYWSETLAGRRLVTFPTDRPLSPLTTSPYAVHRFRLPAVVARAAGRYAARRRCTRFMVLLATFVVLARRHTGDADLVVPTFTAGRGDSSFQDTVGPFFNLLPVRVDTRGQRDFEQVLRATRAGCLAAYANELPFSGLLARAEGLLAGANRPDRALAAFEIYPPTSTTTGRLGRASYVELRERLVSQHVGAGTPTGMLWALDSSTAGELIGTLRYRSDQYDPSTVADLAAEYSSLLARYVRRADGSRT